MSRCRRRRARLSGAMSMTRVEAGYRVVAEARGGAGIRWCRRTTRRLLAGESRLALDVDAPRRRRDRRAARDAALRGRRPCRERRCSAPTSCRRARSSRCGSAQAGRAALPFVPGDVSVASLQVERRARCRRDARHGRVDDCGGGRRERIRPRRRVQRSTRAGRRRNWPRRPTARTTLPLGRHRPRAWRWPIRRCATRSARRCKLTGAGSWSAGQPVSVRQSAARADRRDRELCGTATRRAARRQFRGERSATSRASPRSPAGRSPAARR